MSVENLIVPVTLVRSFWTIAFLMSNDNQGIAYQKPGFGNNVVMENLQRKLSVFIKSGDEGTRFELYLC